MPHHICRSAVPPAPPPFDLVVHNWPEMKKIYIFISCVISLLSTVVIIYESGVKSDQFGDYVFYVFVFCICSCIQYTVHQVFRRIFLLVPNVSYPTSSHVICINEIHVKQY